MHVLTFMYPTVPGGSFKIGRVIGSGARDYFHLQDEETAIRNFLAQVDKRVRA